jgi:hypothetical protein
MLQEFSVAYCITKRPVGVEPVNAAFDTFLFVTNALPSSAPKPLTIFTTPEEGYPYQFHQN